MHIFHRFEPVAAQHMIRTQMNHGVWDEDSAEDVTKVLQRCADCPEVRTTTLEGKWSLHDLQRPAKVP